MLYKDHYVKLVIKIALGFENPIIQYKWEPSQKKTFSSDKIKYLNMYFAYRLGSFESRVIKLDIHTIKTIISFSPPSKWDE